MGKGEMGGVCSRYGRERNAYRVFAGKKKDQLEHLSLEERYY
jgi:hypothetical protein